MINSLKLITLNIEGDRHLDLIKTFLLKEDPDVVCFQEAFEVNLPQLKQALGMESVFTPLYNVNAPNKINVSPLGNCGLSVLSKYSIKNWCEKFYEKHGNSVPVFQDDLPNGIDRAVLSATIIKDSIEFQIATTHFTWSANGQTSEYQKQSLKKLLQTLDEIGECVICGDFNAPRGKEIYRQMCTRFTDNIPPEITTTLDNKIHRVPNIQKLVVDYIFTSKIYQAYNVRVIEGVSDHKAIGADLGKIKL